MQVKSKKSPNTSTTSNYKPQTGQHNYRSGGNKPNSRNQSNKNYRRQRHQESDHLINKIISNRRVSKVVAGGKNFGLSIAVVVGNGDGKVGYGIGKAADFFTAFNKAKNKAMKNMIQIPITKDGCIKYEVKHKFCATSILVKKSKPGIGLKCGHTIQKIMSCGGVKNAICKIEGSTHSNNVMHCMFEIFKAMSNIKLGISRLNKERKMSTKLQAADSTDTKL